MIDKSEFNLRQVLKIFLLSLWGLPSLPFNIYQGLTPGIKQLDHEADLSNPVSTEVMNA
jgi:hypothetical protein